VIDIESEILELKNICRCNESASAEIFFWRIAQILNEVTTGTKLRNRKITDAIDSIEQAMKSMPDSKNKKELEIIVRRKKGEIKKYESRTDTTLFIQNHQFYIHINSNKFMENNVINIFLFTNFRM